MASLYREVYDMFTGPHDPQTIGWSLTDPWPLLYITIAYLAFVLKIGPKLMENREPFSLKTFTTVYNIVQIIGCCWMLHEFIYCGSLAHLLVCPAMGQPFSETSLRLARVMWVYAIFKILEYVETIVFVLRKKQNQVSYLHVYHHTSTLFFSWMVLRFRAGGLGGYIQGMNSFIHIVMYTYYLLSIHASPTWQKRIGSAKKFLTASQMIQFCLMLFTVFQAFTTNECANYKGVVTMFIPNISYVFYLFLMFFIKSYVRPLTTGKSQKTKSQKTN